MISDAAIREQLKYVLTTTSFNTLGKKYEGKVRDSYIADGTRYLITSDRLSCFDVVVTSIPFKGQVLNQLAVEWFKKVNDIIPNHIVDVPDPNVMIVKNSEILPVEIIVRSYLTGSAWRDYEAGKAVSGIKLPPGLRASQKLPELLITPSTKAEKGAHDMPISEKEILSSGLVKPALWEQVKETAFMLFDLAQTNVQKRGLILVDTKYEFGLHQGKLILADEIHTLDSSRYWMANTYQERFEKGESPQMLDKEPVRQWLLSQGYKGDGPVPKFSDDYRVDIAKHYIDSYSKIIGLDFDAKVGPVDKRIEGVLKAIGLI